MIKISNTRFSILEHTPWCVLRWKIKSAFFFATSYKLWQDYELRALCHTFDYNHFITLFNQSNKCRLSGFCFLLLFFCFTSKFIVMMMNQLWMEFIESINWWAVEEIMYFFFDTFSFNLWQRTMAEKMNDKKSFTFF